MSQSVNVPINSDNPTISLKRPSFIVRWPVIPSTILGFLILLAIFAPLIAPHPPLEASLADRNAPPVWSDEGSWNRILGADVIGRDILSRVIHGARLSLLVAFVALVSGVVVGTTLGLVSGYFGGVIDEIITRIVDVWLGLPFILVALVIAVVVGPSLGTMVMLLALLAWTPFVRNVRAEVLSLKSREYVAIAQITGASTTRILIRHLLPGVFNTVMVLASLRIGQLILTESFLSFLGAGIPPPAPSWGAMISDGLNYVRDAWWISVFPGIAIFLTVMSLNFLGDWLRDWLDPRLRQI
ncbi:MAG: ABC transporter permease [Dehalococcoidia bacterium]